MSDFKCITVYCQRHAKPITHKNAETQCILGSRTDVSCSLEDLNLVSKTNLTFSQIYVSPLKRCQETALKILGNEVFKSAKTAPEISEYDFGILDGKPFKDFTNQDNEIIENFSKNPILHNIPKAQNYLDFSNKIRKFILDILASSKDQEQIMLITHLGVISEILALFIDLPISKIITTLGTDYAMCTKLEFYVNTKVVINNSDTYLSQDRLITLPSHIFAKIKNLNIKI